MKHKQINFNDFLKNLSKHKLIILGEIHGTNEIPQIVSKIIKRLGEKLNLIFLEIPMNQQKYIDDYINLKKENGLYQIPFFYDRTLQDGRNSKSILSLIKSIKKLMNLNKKIRIICVDPINGNREYLIYKKIKKSMKKSQGVNIFLTGNVHASKEKININREIVTPCGYYLNKWLQHDLISVNFIPKRGKFYNLRVKKISNKNSEIGIFISKIKNYDLDYIIKKSTPAQFFYKIK